MRHDAFLQRNLSSGLAMKNALFYGTRDIRVEETKDDDPKPGEVLLEVTAVGICGSDLHTYLLGNVGGTAPEYPLTLGHEAAGIVRAVGAGVEHVRVGQKVAIDPATHCGVCERCEAGQPHLCANLKFMGLYPYHGALRERMTHSAHSIVPVPDSISAVDTAMLEPLGVALHAIRLANIELGEDVFVVGCGAIGLLIIALARLNGARHIFAVDRFPWRLDMAANYGADILLNAEKDDVLGEVARRTNKRGVDLAIEAAWVTDTANQCAEVARLGGRVIIVGIPSEDSFTLKASTVRRKELRIMYSRRMKHTYPASIALAASGKVALAPLATHVYTLDEAPAAFETAATYADHVVRAVVKPVSI
jgi:L-iditol 2-dehydrogenase